MSNKRFINKGLVKGDYATLQALIRYYEAGGGITVASKPKRPKRGYTIGNPKKAKG
jgi:hypothetical protein